MFYLLVKICYPVHTLEKLMGYFKPHLLLHELQYNINNILLNLRYIIVIPIQLSLENIYMIIIHYRLYLYNTMLYTLYWCFCLL